MELNSPALRGSPQRELLGQIARAALAAVDAEVATRKQLGWLGNDSIRIGSVLLPTPKAVHLLAVGKAAAPMARGAMAGLANKVERCLVITSREDTVEGAEHVRGEHPLPGPGSLAAGQRAKSFAAELDAGDLLLVCVSGGASAMMASPRTGSIESLAETTRTLMRAGLPIELLNRARAALDELKFGGLAHLASPADCGALILSDVPGDEMSLVGSGPTRRRDNPSVRAELEAAGVWEPLDDASRELLAVDHPAPPRAARAPFDLLVAVNADARRAAGDVASEHGYEVISLGMTLKGEAQAAGREFVRACDDPKTRELSPGRRCVIAGGETTVTQRGQGRGGRTLEFAYGVAQAIAGRDGVRVMILATDGEDGNSGAAGTYVDGSTLTRAQAAGLDLADAAKRNDLAPAFEALGDIIVTGPTGTNVCDLAVWLEDELATS